jgi:signal transduction histidine kinase
MAATIAHEVRNPAGIIRNYLSLIRPALNGHDVEAKYLNVINEELGRIELFVQSLLGAFHPDRTQPTSLALPTQIREVVAFLAPRLAQHGVAVSNQLDETIPMVHAEPEALRQVILNLILNAADAMPTGGTLTFGASADLEHVHLSVADTGTGIPIAVLDRLFDPFVTTKPEGEGSGLGLSICRSLLERFDAQIGAKNLPPPAHGAIFTIHLRRADSPGHHRIGGPAHTRFVESES